MMINDIARQIHIDNIDRGWWAGILTGTSDVLDAKNPVHRTAVLEKLLLVHTEISEAVEEIRNGATLRGIAFEMPKEKPVGFPTEIADAVIRLFDLAEACAIDLEAVIDMKLAYNRTRGHRHGGKLL